MGRFLSVAVMVSLVVIGCANAQTRAKAVAGPEGERHFRTYCKRIDACLQDARDICPDGYTKENVHENPRETEFSFMCHGRVDY